MYNSYKELKEALSKANQKYKLLLHSCCAPCSSHVLMLLKPYFDITIYYTNDNIYPESEYQARLLEQIRFCKNIDHNIQVVADPYLPNDFNQQIEGLEQLGERSQRCYNCYKLRLEKTAKKAKELSFDFFTTTLSISPYKVTSWINEIGLQLEKKYQIPFLYSDFKKEEGYKHSITLSKEYGLYRQDYCGCIYSLKERSMHDE